MAPQHLGFDELRRKEKDEPGGEGSSSSRIRCQNGATMQASHRGLHESEGNKWRKQQMQKARKGHCRPPEKSAFLYLQCQPGQQEGAQPSARRPSQTGNKMTVRSAPTLTKKKDVADWKKQSHETIRRSEEDEASKPPKRKRGRTWDKRRPRS